MSKDTTIPIYAQMKSYTSEMLLGKIAKSKSYCKSIADGIELIVENRLCRCPECGEGIDVNVLEDVSDDNLICPSCKAKMYADEIFNVTVIDYFDDCEIEYRSDAKEKYLNVEITSTCGKYDITVDTKAASVSLCSQGEIAEWPISGAAVSAIDDVYRRLWNLR